MTVYVIILARMLHPLPVAMVFLKGIPLFIKLEGKYNLQSMSMLGYDHQNFLIC